MSGLTHINAAGEAVMVDVADKAATWREAVAEGFVVMKKETLMLIAQHGVPKGDAIAVARVAGIMAAKRTHELIPLCHPVPLTKVTVSFDFLHEESAVRIEASAKALGQTGVEMEALTTVTVACLTLYDMLKAKDKGIHFEGIRLLSKTGGASGDFIVDSTGEVPPWR